MDSRNTHPNKEAAFGTRVLAVVALVPVPRITAAAYLSLSTPSALTMVSRKFKARQIQYRHVLSKVVFARLGLSPLLLSVNTTGSSPHTSTHATEKRTREGEAAVTQVHVIAGGTKGEQKKNVK
jgi:hypothetical protein